MSINYNPSISTAGLILCIDSYNARCYTGSGSTVVDVSGNNNNLTVAGTTYSATQGWNFAGGSTSNYMIRNPISMPTTTISVEVWCKTTGSTSGIVSYASSAADNDFLIYDPSNVSLYTAAGAVSTGVNIADGNWKQLVRTRNATTGAEVLYVNGASAYTGTLTAGTLVTTGGSFVLAQEQDSVGGGFDPGQSFSGNIAIVRLYNSVLTAAQVLQNFDATRGRFGI
jgi:hypothetical protein